MFVIRGLNARSACLVASVIRTNFCIFCRLIICMLFSGRYNILFYNKEFLSLIIGLEASRSLYIPEMFFLKTMFTIPWIYGINRTSMLKGGERMWRRIWCLLFIINCMFSGTVSTALHLSRFSQGGSLPFWTHATASQPFHETIYLYRFLWLKALCAQAAAQGFFVRKI